MTIFSAWAGRFLSLVAALSLANGLLQPAWAGEPSAAPASADLERRVQELEATIGRMQASSPAAQSPTVLSFDGNAAPADANASPATEPLAGPSLDHSGKGGEGGRSILAGWDKGFFMRSADKAFDLRITGQIQADYRAFLDVGDRADVDTFLVRRARLGIEATVFEYYEFRLLPDFGQGQSRVQDAYLNVHYVDWLQVEAGRFKQPVSYEQLIQDRFVPTAERSLIDQIVPSRDAGLMVHGQKLFGNRFDYALAVANGTINGDADTSDHKDFSGRL